MLLPPCRQTALLSQIQVSTMKREFNIKLQHWINYTMETMYHTVRGWTQLCTNYRIILQMRDIRNV